MKLLILLILLVPMISSAQHTKAYLHLHGGLSWSNEATTKRVLGLSAGPKIGQAIGVGVGLGFIQFEKPYIPLTIDFTFMPLTRKVNPIAGIKGGYGFFNYNPSSGTTVRGGLVTTAFAGITLSAIKFRPNVTVGGTRYAFKESYPGKTKNSDDKRIFAAIGILF